MGNFEQNNNSVEALLKDAAKLQPDNLAYIVEFFEATEPGQTVVQKNPNRKLYAVLKPTPDEYLQRLEALLLLTDQETSMMFREYLRVSLPFIKLAERIDQYWRIGQISSLAADDLIHRIYAIAPLVAVCSID